MTIATDPPDQFRVTAYYCEACGHSANLPGWCNPLSGPDLRPLPLHTAHHHLAISKSGKTQVPSEWA